MSLNNKINRRNLYNKTFFKWTVAQRLSTLEKTSIELSLAVHNFGNTPTDKTRNTLLEKISDIETMIEVFDQGFEGSRPLINGITKKKLSNLKRLSEVAPVTKKEVSELKKQEPTEKLKTRRKLFFWSK